jgi:hypothetical protein
MYLCIYNPDTLEIDCQQFFKTEMEAEESYPMWQLECRNRGGSWKPYKGETEFSFPEPVEEPADEE